MTKQIEDYPLPQNLEDWLNTWNTIPKASARAQFVEMQQQIDSLTEQNKELQEKLEPDMFWNKDEPEMSFDSIEELFDYYGDHFSEHKIEIECNTATSMPNKTFVGRYDEDECEWVVTELNKESK